MTCRVLALTVSVLSLITNDKHGMGTCLPCTSWTCRQWRNPSAPESNTPEVVNTGALYRTMSIACHGQGCVALHPPMCDGAIRGANLDRAVNKLASFEFYWGSTFSQLRYITEGKARPQAEQQQQQQQQQQHKSSWPGHRILQSVSSPWVTSSHVISTPRCLALFNSYSPKWRWIAVDIYRAASAT